MLAFLKEQEERQKKLTAETAEQFEKRPFPRMRWTKSREARETTRAPKHSMRVNGAGLLIPAAMSSRITIQRAN